MFTEDEQIGNWVSRANGRYKLKPMPKTVEGMMDINKEKVCFNFLKSLEIANINNETLLLHPSAHEFWDEEEIRTKLMEFLVGWSKNPIVYAKVNQKAQYQDEATSALRATNKTKSNKLKWVLWMVCLKCTN